VLSAGHQRKREMRYAAIILAGLLAQSIRVHAGQDDAVRALRDGAYAQAEALAQAWSSEVEATNAPDSLKVAQALDLVVATALANGKAADSATLASARRAVAIKERQLGPSSADLATSLHNLAGIHDRRGEFLVALPLHERALSIRRLKVPPDSPEIADSLDARTRTLLSLDRRSDAERAIERSLVIRLAHATDSPLKLARTLELSGRAKRDAGRYQDAADDLDRALELWNQFAPNHPDKGGALDERGYVCVLQGDIPGSRRVWSEASALADERLHDWHPERARSLRSLALAEFALGELGSARALRERAVSIGERSMSSCDPEVAFQFNDLAISLQYDGDYAGAERLFRREVATMRTCLGPHHVNLATAVFNQFVLAREMGSYAEAQQLGQRAVQLWTNALGPNHPFVALGLNDLAGHFVSGAASSESITPTLLGR